MSSLLGKVQSLFTELKTHWNTPAEGKYVPYKEYIPESVTYIGHHAFWDTVYKENDELRGVTEINVAASEECFESAVKTGNSWRPQYDFLLFKKSVEIVYCSERAIN